MAISPAYVKQDFYEFVYFTYEGFVIVGVRTDVDSFKGTEKLC